METVALPYLLSYLLPYFLRFPSLYALQYKLRYIYCQRGTKTSSFVHPPKTAGVHHEYYLFSRNFRLRMEISDHAVGFAS